MCFTGSPLVSPVIPVFPFCLLFLTVDPHPSSDTRSLWFTVKHQPSNIGPKPFTSRPIFSKTKVSLLGCPKWNYHLPLSKWGSFPISPHFIPVEALFFNFKIRALKSHLPMASSLKSQVSASFVSHSHLSPSLSVPQLPGALPRFLRVSWLVSLPLIFLPSHLVSDAARLVFPELLSSYQLPSSNFLPHAIQVLIASQPLSSRSQLFILSCFSLFNNFFQASIFPSYSLLFCVSPPPEAPSPSPSQIVSILRVQLDALY